MTADRRESSAQHLGKYIRCPECGEQIPMVPVLSEMIQNIESHLEIHKENERRDTTLPRVNELFIQDSLTEQVLQRAAESTEAPNKNSTWIRLE